jgi:hypothetical protein
MHGGHEHVRGELVTDQLDVQGTPFGVAATKPVVQGGCIIKVEHVLELMEQAKALPLVRLLLVNEDFKTARNRVRGDSAVLANRVAGHETDRHFPLFAQPYQVNIRTVCAEPSANTGSLQASDLDGFAIAQWPRRRERAGR